MRRHTRVIEGTRIGGMQADQLIEAKPLCVQAELRRSGYGQPLCTAVAPELQVAAVAVSFDLAVASSDARTGPGTGGARHGS